jgi:hypothetical protein
MQCQCLSLSDRRSCGKGLAVTLFRISLCFCLLAASFSECVVAGEKMGAVRVLVFSKLFTRR